VLYFVDESNQESNHPLLLASRGVAKQAFVKFVLSIGATKSQLNVIASQSTLQCDDDSSRGRLVRSWQGWAVDARAASGSRGIRVETRTGLKGLSLRLEYHVPFTSEHSDSFCSACTSPFMHFQKHMACMYAVNCMVTSQATIITRSRPPQLCP
jgi:hypothetical protein